MNKLYFEECVDCLAGQLGNLMTRMGIGPLEPIVDDINILREGARRVLERMAPAPRYDFLFNGSLDPENLRHERILEEYLKLNAGLSYMASGYYGGIIYPAAEYRGNPDPFAEIKDRANRLVAPVAMDLLRRYRGKITRELVMERLIPFSLGANLLQDFGRVDAMDNLEAAEAILERSASDFEEYTLVDEREELFGTLEGARALLMVPDNAGEFLLDLILLRGIKVLFPGIGIFVAGRGRIVNDISGEDIRALMADKSFQPLFEIDGKPFCEIVDTGQVPGMFSLFGACEPGFGRLLETDGLVMIGKGQASLEIMPVLDRLQFQGFEVSLDDVETYIISRAKCVQCRGILKTFTGLDFDPVDPRWESFAPGVVVSRRTLRESAK